MLTYSFFRNYYTATEDGNIIRTAAGQRTRIGYKLKQELLPNGYKKVMLSACNKQHQFLVHRLVAETFIPNRNNKPCVNHKNGIKTDNRVENLEWCNWGENMRHASTLGLLMKFDMKKTLKFEDVQEIRSLHSRGMTQTDIAKKFNINQCHVSRLVNNKRRTKPCRK